MTPDRNVHTMPVCTEVLEHIESKDCWCEPRLADDFTDAVWKLENARLEHERDVLLSTMHEIASWEEGPEVTMGFDCPPDALTARQALASIGITGAPK